jgi:hypothetical protein
MSTLSCQLLVCSSALTEDIYRTFLRKNAGQTELVWVSRAMVMAIALVAIGIASNPEAKVLGMVSYAWAGFGVAFGLIIILSLFWPRVTRNVALASMVVGAVTAVLWKQGGWLGCHRGGQPPGPAFSHHAAKAPGVGNRAGQGLRLRRQASGRGRRQARRRLGRLAPALPGFFMEEKGKGLHRGLQQAERQRQQEVAGDRIGHQGGNRDVQQVIGSGFLQGRQIVTGKLNHGFPSVLWSKMPFAHYSHAQAAIKKVVDETGGRFCVLAKSSAVFNRFKTSILG